MSPEARAYARLVMSWTVERLLDALVSANTANTYGSHDEQIAILRDEIVSRTS